MTIEDPCPCPDGITRSGLMKEAVAMRDVKGFFRALFTKFI